MYLAVFLYSLINIYELFIFLVYCKYSYSYSYTYTYNIFLYK